MTEPEDRAWEEAMRAGYRHPAADEAGTRRRLLERLASEPPPRRHSGPLAWWLTPRPLAMRPAVVLTALLAVSLAGVWLGRVSAPHAIRVTRPPAVLPANALGRLVEDGTPVTFVFDAPGAATVSLVGDFNGWDPHATPLRRSASGGRWTAEVSLDRGLHLYGYVIDDHVWAIDPAAPLTPERTFGRRNSVILVGEDGIL
ncbi:MAG: isoamylase early set domain-containing protein [Candidatus Eisenbacteria bacterium]